jgi:hypothetical protein
MQRVANVMGEMVRFLNRAPNHAILIASYQSVQAMLCQAEFDGDDFTATFARATMRSVLHDMNSRLPSVDAVDESKIIYFVFHYTLRTDLCSIS